MSKKQPKTVPTAASVEDFVAGIKDETRRDEVKTVMTVLKRATGAEPKLWANGVIGFGSYHYKYPSGQEGDWFITGLSPRKANLTIYILPGLHLHQTSLKSLGRFTTGKSCIYIRSLEDIHLPTLEKMAKQAVTDMKEETRRRKG